MSALRNVVVGTFEGFLGGSGIVLIQMWWKKPESWRRPACYVVVVSIVGIIACLNHYFPDTAKEDADKAEAQKLLNTLHWQPPLTAPTQGK